MRMKGTVLLLAVVVFASCTEVLLHPMPDRGGVTVDLDWGTAVAPDKMVYMFYPEAGSPVTLEGGGSTFTGELPVGAYRMLAYDASTAGVYFSGMDNYATATVSAQTVSATRTGDHSVFQPGALFSGRIENLTVLPIDTIRMATAPRQLTRSLKLTFLLSETLGVDELEGTLCGIYPSLLLATGKPSVESVAAAPATNTAFSASVETEKRVSIMVRFFGLRNPEEGKKYTNTLHLTLKGNDGWKQQATVDLSKALTDILAAGGEEFAFEIPTSLEIKVEPTPVSFAATVAGWTLGEGGGEIDYIY